MRSQALAMPGAANLHRVRPRPWRRWVCDRPVPVIRVRNRDEDVGHRQTQDAEATLACVRDSPCYRTVTDLARFRGRSTGHPLAMAQ